MKIKKKLTKNSQKNKICKWFQKEKGIENDVAILHQYNFQTPDTFKAVKTWETNRRKSEYLAELKQKKLSVIVKALRNLFQGCRQNWGLCYTRALLSFKKKIKTGSSENKYFLSMPEELTKNGKKQQQSGKFRQYAIVM